MKLLVALLMLAVAVRGDADVAEPLALDGLRIDIGRLYAIHDAIGEIWDRMRPDSTGED